MKVSHNGATYLKPGTSNRTKNVKSNGIKVFILALVAIALCFVSFPLIQANVEGPTNNTLASAAWEIACSDKLGHGMDNNANWYSSLMAGGIPASDKRGRTLTAQEAFGQGAQFVHYDGETSATAADRDGWTKKTDRKSYVKKAWFSPAKNQERVNDLRTFSRCTIGALPVWIANGIFKLDQVTSTVLSGFVSFAFSTNIVCPKAATDGQGFCVDLLFITGGTSKNGTANGGLIGSLTQSIYIPLLSLVVLVVGMWVLYTGIIQRKIREALWGAIWTVLAVIIGLALLLKPAMLASAPASISNTLAGCVISAFGGNNCFGGSPQNPNDADAIKTVCVATASNPAVDEQMQLIAASLTCSIWKAFILQTYSQASFGSSFDDLYTDEGQGAALVSRTPGIKAIDFCVRLKTSGTVEEQKDSTLKLDSGPPICNIALYQMYIQVNAEAPDDASAGYMIPSGSTEVDSRWYKIIRVTANNQATWNAWSGGGMGKIWIALLTGLSVLIGGLVLSIIAIFAIMYYFIAIFLMAFAPLFFLIGVHPGKGRDVLKGYAEQVLSNILKYVASALFLVVALGLYGGIIGSANSPGMAFLLVMILSVALFYYRKELVELIGTVNMGGQQMGQNMKSMMNDKFNLANKDSDLSRLGTTAVASGVGAGFAGKSPGAALRGFNKGALNELKRPGGLMGSTGAGLVRGAEYATRDNKQKIDNKVAAAKSTTAETNAVYQQANDEATEGIDAYNNLNAEMKQVNESVEDLKNTLQESDNRADILHDMNNRGGDDALYAQAMSDNFMVTNTDQAITLAIANGEDVSDLRATREAYVNSRDAKVATLMLNPETFDDLNNEYNASTSEWRKNAQNYNAKVAEQQGLAEELDEAEVVAAAAINKAAETGVAAKTQDARIQEMTKKQEDYRKEAVVGAGKTKEFDEKSKDKDTEKKRQADTEKLTTDLLKGLSSRAGATSEGSIAMPQEVNVNVAPGGEFKVDLGPELSSPEPGGNFDSPEIDLQVELPLGSTAPRPSRPKQPKPSDSKPKGIPTSPEAPPESKDYDYSGDLFDNDNPMFEDDD